MNVGDILKFGGLSDAKLIAGKGGLDNPVSSISVLEVAEAKIKEWVLDNQLYLTSFYAISQDTAKQLEVISALYENNCSGLILCHIDLFLKDIDGRLIEYCNQKDFPLIIANSKKSYVEILYPIVMRLMENNKNTAIEALNQMQSRMIELIATKKDVNFIYSSIQREYGGAFYFLDTENNLIYPRILPKEEKFMDLVEKQLKYRQAMRNPQHFIAELGGRSFIVYSVESRGVWFGTILAEILQDDLNGSLVKLRYIANLVSLIATKHYRVQEIEKVRKQEYISDLLTWNFRSIDVAIARGKSVGWNIENKKRLIIVNVNDIQLNIDDNKDFTRFLEDILYEYLKKIIRLSNAGNIIGLRSDTFIILLDDDEINDLKTALLLCQQLLACCNNNFSGSVSIGISNIIETCREIPEAYSQAMDALKIGRSFFGDNRITACENIAYFNLFREFKKINHFKNISNSLFQSLEEYDLTQNNCLLPTLKELIMNQMDTKATAEKLFVHHNTINYRKHKITEILGYRPWEMPYLFNTLMYLVSDMFEE